MTIPNILNDDRVWNNVKPLKNEINYPPQITSVYGRNSCQRCKWRTAIWLLQQLIWLTGSQFSLAKGFIGPTVPKKQAIFRRNFTPTCRKVASKNMENPPDICRELLVFCSDGSPRSTPDPPGSVWIQLALDRNETCLLGLGDSAPFGSSTVSWLCMRWDMSGILPDLF